MADLTKEQRARLEAEAVKLNKEAVRLAGDGDLDRALGLAELALIIRERLYPEDKYPQGHPDLALSVQFLATLRHARGDYGKALPLHERALAL